MNKELTAVSLFTGAGGMDVGFERAGIKVVFANELMKEAAQTYNARPIRLMFLQRRELLIMELFLSTMLKITMKQSFQGSCSCRSRKNCKEGLI